MALTSKTPRFILNGNGTSAGALRQERETILRQAQELEASLLRMTVHGRDYQINAAPKDEYLDDRLDRGVMIEDVRAIREYMINALMRINEQGGI